MKVRQIGDREGEAMGTCSDWDDILNQNSFKLSQKSKKMDQAEGLRSSSDDEDSTHHATKRRGCNQTMMRLELKKFWGVGRQNLTNHGGFH